MLKEYIPFRTSTFWYNKIQKVVERENVPQSWFVRYLVELGFKHFNLSDMRKRAREEGVI